MKIFCESENEGVIDEIFAEMIILNLIKITSKEKSLFTKDFDDDNDCLLIFRENVFFNTYLFDIARLIIFS